MSEHLEFLQEYIPLLRNNFNIDTIFPRFKNYVIDNIDEICQELNTRWLVLICDTLVDHSDDEIETYIAFNISFLVNYERLSQTNYNKNSIVDMVNVKELWDGCDSFHLINGDTILNLISRMSKLNHNINYPHLSKIFKTVLDRMYENDTTIGRLTRGKSSFI